MKISLDLQQVRQVLDLNTLTRKHDSLVMTGQTVMEEISKL